MFEEVFLAGVYARPLWSSQAAASAVAPEDLEEAVVNGSCLVACAGTCLGPQKRSVRCGEEKNFSPLPGIEPGLASPKSSL